MIHLFQVDHIGKTTSRQAPTYTTSVALLMASGNLTASLHFNRLATDFGLDVYCYATMTSFGRSTRFTVRGAADPWSPPHQVP